MRARTRSSSDMTVSLFGRRHATALPQTEPRGARRRRRREFFRVCRGLPSGLLSFSLRNLAPITGGVLAPLYNPRKRPARGSTPANFLVILLFLRPSFVELL